MEGRKITKAENPVPMPKYAIINNKKVRTGFISKFEVCQAVQMSCNFFNRVIHQNVNLMRQLEALGYKKTNKLLTIRQANLIARHLDVYIEGVYEEPITNLDGMEQNITY
ncbi:MAG: DUF4248 domain-containing protein [Bacteroidales bacterium]|nr:DUF4248 domain-containing protein [Bacteroidales bacterium]